MNKITFWLVVLLLFAFLLAGCNKGDDGNNNSPSPDDDTDDDASDDDILCEVDDDFSDNWKFYEIDSEGYLSSIAVDNDIAVYIVYISNNRFTLKYATNEGGEWQIFSVDEAEDGIFDWNTSLSLSGDGTLHIAYRYLQNEQGALKYVSGFPGSWQVDVVDEVSAWALSSPSMQVDHMGNAHIVYCKGDKLMYAFKSLGAWQISQIESAGKCRVPALALDEDDNSHITYCDKTNLQLKYTTNQTSEWQTFIIDSNVGEGSLSNTSLALDSSNFLHIAYWGDNLKYATNKSGAWKIYNITTPDVYLVSQPSLALDTKRCAHINYINYPSDSDAINILRYVTNRSGAWEVTALDTVSRTGAYLGSSIKVDVDGNVHMLYVPGDVLLYVTNRP